MGSKPVNRPPLNRIRWGALVLILGFLSPLLIPVVLRSGLSETLKSIISGGLALGIPELFMVLAVSIMGKEGFNYLKRYVRVLYRNYGPPERVSKTRYRVGIFLFLIPLVFGFFAPYVLMKNQYYLENVFLLTIISDVIVLISLFVLGGEFWDKLRSLFIHGAVARFPEQCN